MIRAWRVSRLIEALEWYADETNYENELVDIGVGSQEIPNSNAVVYDRGGFAQVVLAEMRRDDEVQS